MAKIGILLARLFGVNTVTGVERLKPDICLYTYVRANYNKYLSRDDTFKIIHASFTEVVSHEAISQMLTKTVKDVTEISRLSAKDRMKSPGVNINEKARIEESVYLALLFHDSIRLYTWFPRFIQFCLLIMENRKFRDQDFIYVCYRLHEILFEETSKPLVWRCRRLVSTILSDIRKNICIIENVPGESTLYFYSYQDNPNSKILVYALHFLNFRLDPSSKRHSEDMYPLLDACLEITWEPAEGPKPSDELPLTIGSFTADQSIRQLETYLQFFRFCLMHDPLFIFDYPEQEIAVGRAKLWLTNEEVFSKTLELIKWTQSPSPIALPAFLQKTFTFDLLRKTSDGMFQQLYSPYDETDLIALSTDDYSFEKKPLLTRMGNNPLDRVTWFTSDAVVFQEENPEELLFLDIYAQVSRSVLWHFGITFIDPQGKRHYYCLLTGENHSGEETVEIPARVYEIFSRPPRNHTNLTQIDYVNKSSLLAQVLSMNLFDLDPNFICNIAIEDDADPSRYLFRKFVRDYFSHVLVICIQARIARIDFLFWFFIRNLDTQLWQSICYLIDQDDFLLVYHENQTKREFTTCREVHSIYRFWVDYSQRFEIFQQKWKIPQLNTSASKYTMVDTVEKFYDPIFGSSEFFSYSSLIRDFTDAKAADFLCAKYRGMLIRYLYRLLLDEDPL